MVEAPMCKTWLANYYSYKRTVGRVCFKGLAAGFPLAFPFIPAKYGMKYGKTSLPTLESPENPA
jgi:hypothetical protein